MTGEFQYQQRAGNALLFVTFRQIPTSATSVLEDTPQNK